MANQKCTVYILRSVRQPTAYYVGSTSNLAARLETHNSGGNTHTAAARPWEVVVTIQFSQESKALTFERYLKSGSGRAFAQTHFR